MFTDLQCSMTMSTSLVPYLLPQNKRNQGYKFEYKSLYEHEQRHIDKYMCKESY